MNKDYWDKDSTESMYDKNLLDIEIKSILKQLNKDDIVIDIGCGEGEGTVEYYKKVKKIVGLDFSITRLEKLLSRNADIETIQHDLQMPLELERKFTIAISQRCLINLKDFKEQSEAIKNIYSVLEDHGRLILLEGFNEGVDNLNKIREDFSIPIAQVKWHNCFFNKKELMEFIEPYFTLEYQRDFSIYSFLTRAFNAILLSPDVPKWHSKFNELARKMENRYENNFLRGLSRLELLVFKKRLVN